MFLPHPRVKVSIVGSLRDREVACSASDRQGSNFEFCVWRTVSSQSSHHPREVILAQFSLYVHKGGLKPDSFHFYIHSTGVFSHSNKQWNHLLGHYITFVVWSAISYGLSMLLYYLKYVRVYTCSLGVDFANHSPWNSQRSVAKNVKGAAIQTHSKYLSPL